MALTVSFREFESYDINLDCDVVMYMAITSRGSFFATAPVGKDQVRRRKEFKEKVIELMQEGCDPGELVFDEAVE